MKNMKWLSVLLAIVMICASLAACGESAADKKKDAADAEPMTQEEAEDIALSETGQSRDDVVFTKSELDADDSAYEIELECQPDEDNPNKKKTYSYTIDAVSGEILEFSVNTSISFG